MINNKLNSSQYEPSTRRYVMGIIFLVASAVIFFIFSPGREGAEITTFNMVPGGSTTQSWDCVFPTQPYLSALAGVCLVMGGYQLARGFKKATNVVLAIVAGMFIFSFLAWAACGGSMNLGGLLRITVIRAVPLTLGAMAGILC